MEKKEYISCKKINFHNKIETNPKPKQSSSLTHLPGFTSRCSLKSIFKYIFQAWLMNKSERLEEKRQYTFVQSFSVTEETSDATKL